MNLTAAQFTNEEESAITLTVDNKELTCPWPCHTWHREYIQAWLDAGNVIAPFEGPTPAERRKEARDAIDIAAGQSRLRFVSPGALVDQEYKFAAEEAEKFKAAEYLSPVPDSIQSWADVTGMTAQEAADDILATEAQWKIIAALIRRKRFEGRKAVDDALEADIETVRDSYITQLEAIQPEG